MYRVLLFYDRVCIHETLNTKHDIFVYRFLNSKLNPRAGTIDHPQQVPFIGPPDLELLYSTHRRRVRKYFTWAHIVYI